MRIQNTIKRTALVVLILLLFTPLVLADVVYLKDGSILRGKITEETNEFITIEGEDYWKIFNRMEIKKIIKELKQPEKVKELEQKIKQLQEEFRIEKTKIKELKKESKNLLGLVEDFEKACGLYNRLYNDNIKMRPRPGYKLTYTGQHNISKLNTIMRSRRWIFLIRSLSRLLKTLAGED